MSYAPKILIVHDEARMCDSLKMLLTTEGYEVHTGYSGTQALECLAKNDFDLVLLDIVMPDVNGYQIMDYVNSRNPETYVIIITGHATVDSAIESLRRGAYDYLRKPFEHEELLQTAKNALDQKRLNSERKLAEEAQRESERKYHVLFDMAKDAIFVSDETGRFVDVNEAACRSLGYSKEELLKLSNREIDADPRGYEAFLKVRDGQQEQITFEVNQQRKDGTPVPVEITGNFFKSGGQRMAMAIARDITDRKRAEKALREAKTLLEKTFANLDEAVFVVDPNMRTIVACNPAVERIFGYSEKEVVGRNTEFLHVSRRTYEDFARNAFPALNARGVYHREFRMRRKNGNVFFTDHTVTEIIDDSGRRTGVVSVVRDIDRRKQAEEALKKAHDELEQRVEERTAELVKANEQLKREIEQRKRAERALKQQTYDLGKRLKEMNCLYGISDLVEKPGVSLEAILQGVVNLIPPAWQYSEITCARIIFRDQEYKTGNFRETVWRQASNIVVRGERIGSLEVCYLEERPERDEGPFLKEERSLIDAIAKRLGRITEHVQAEEALKENEGFTSSLLINSPMPILVVNPDTSIRYVNPALEKLTGFSSAQVIGRKAPYPWWIRETLEKTSRDLEEAMLKGTQRLEELFQKNNGERFWVEITSAPITSNAKLKYYLANWVDITERKRVERARRESEKKYRQVVENLNEGIWLVDKDAYTTFLNPRMAEILGYTAEEMQGKHLFSFLDEEGVAFCKRNLERRKQGLKEQFDFEFLRKDGTRVYASLQVSPMIDDDGKYAGAIAGVWDITERKRVEEQIRRLSHQLILAQESGRQRISYELHDVVGQELSALMIGLDTFFDNQPEPPPEMRQRLSEQLKILQGAIAAVRNLSHTLRSTGLDRRGLVPAALRYCEEFSDKNQVKVDFFAAGINESRLDFHTKINLYRVIQESLNNVKKHADASHVTVRLLGSFPKIILRIEDNGKGFDVQNRLLSEANEKHMGLRIMEERVALLAGKMRVESLPKQGAKIIIEVPYKRKSSGQKKRS